MRKFFPVEVIVPENLASADPYYRGPHRSSTLRTDEPIVPLDRQKTRLDLGRGERTTLPPERSSLRPGQVLTLTSLIHGTPRR